MAEMLKNNLIVNYGNHESDFVNSDSYKKAFFENYKRFETTGLDFTKLNS